MIILTRYLTVLLATLVILTVGPTAQAAWRSKECRFQTLDGRTGWSEVEVRRTIYCAATRFGIDVEMALFVAEHESGLSATAGDSHCGIYQHTRSSFPYRIDGAEARWPHYSWFGRKCENARSNIFAAFDLVKDTGGWEVHWCQWTRYC